MKYFTIEELCYSATAKRKGIDNIPSKEHVINMERLINKLLDPVRQKWGSPLEVSSGYRCPELNAAVGGSATSDHMNGCAADITTGSIEGNKRLYDAVKDMVASKEAVVDQVIEYPSKNYSLVHVSLRAASNRNQALIY